MFLPYKIQTSYSDKSSSPNPHRQPIKRKLVVKKEDYQKMLVLSFNKIIGMTKKDKDQFFAFTNLKIYLSSDDTMFFGLTPDSRIIQLEKDFYSINFKQM